MNYCNGCKYLYTDYNTDGSVDYACERDCPPVWLSTVRVFDSEGVKTTKAIPHESCVMFEEREKNGKV